MRSSALEPDQRTRDGRAHTHRWRSAPTPGGVPGGSRAGDAGPVPSSSCRRAAYAGAVAAVVSGLPSTASALASGGDALAATRAAGTLVPGHGDRPGLGRGVAVHVAVSTVWTAALAIAARRRRIDARRGAAAGLAIAAVDLGVIGRRYPAMRALPRAPQVLDHLAFGAVVGHLLGQRRQTSERRVEPW